MNAFDLQRAAIDKRRTDASRAAADAACVKIERDRAIAQRDAYRAALASLSSVLRELQEAMLAGRIEMDDATREAVSIGLDRVGEALEEQNDGQRG